LRRGREFVTADVRGRAELRRGSVERTELRRRSVERYVFA
jgi:hypothetical protein